MRNLIIVRGLPGSGKSTFAELLSRAICTADDFYMDRDGNYNWVPDKIHIAHKWCQRKCERFMKADIPLIVVANTSTTTKELKIYENLAEEYNYKVFSVVVENRHGGKNTHGVPEETLRKMEDRFNIKLI